MIGAVGIEGYAIHGSRWYEPKGYSGLLCPEEPNYHYNHILLHVVTPFSLDYDK
jgi:hypothetical protein